MGDITKITPKDIPDFDVLLAGFPCQPFSIAGSKKGLDEARGTLFYNIAEIIKEKQPAAFFLENVKNLFFHDQGNTWKIILRVLEHDLDYHVHYIVINAKNFGLPQSRSRIYIVGFKENLEFRFPYYSMGSNPVVKLKDYLEQDVDPEFYVTQRYLYWMIGHRKHHEALGHGYGYEIVDPEGIANALVCGGMGKDRNLIADKPIPNTWQKEGDDLGMKNNQNLRRMTPREWARVQGFPESFKLNESKTQLYKLLGNSVAVPVVKAIALQMKTSLNVQQILAKKNHFDLPSAQKTLLSFFSK
jgi:DNA (cytosine-5)-methyltransferase 1